MNWHQWGFTFGCGFLSGVSFAIAVCIPRLRRELMDRCDRGVKKGIAEIHAKRKQEMDALFR